MLTIYETPTFISSIAGIWDEVERSEFFSWLALNPLAGAVIRDSGGCRKLRWTRPGTGKSGGARVIYFTRLNDGELWLLVAYAKSVRATIPGPTLKKIREELERGDHKKAKSKSKRKGN
jgi:hypothetical protein